MGTIHISEAEAGSNFADLMDRVRAGSEIVIESDDLPVAVLRLCPTRSRLLSDSLALAQARTRERGYEIEIDPEFALGVEKRIRDRKPRDTRGWDRIRGADP